MGWRYGQPYEHEKPKGLWVSVDGENDWAEWCEAESFGLNPLRYRIVLAPDANVLHLKDALDIRVFTERYWIETELLAGYRRRAIDWPRVASEYQGIIIAPYCWECRLDEAAMWYYGWDCASGCIWDAAAVASIEPMVEAAA